MFLIYLIESSVAFSILYLFYKYVFYQNTYFEWNRLYFYLMLFYSLLLPFLRTPYFSLFTNNLSSQLFFTENFRGGNLYFIKENLNWFNEYLLNNPFGYNYFNLYNLLIIIYISGFLRKLVLFFIKNRYLLQLIRKTDFIKADKIKIATVDMDLAAFGYFHYVFFGNKFKKLNKNDQEQILQHERIHAHQLHSVDILLFELFDIVFWFNPLIRSAKNTLKNIHEYIVDAIIIKNSNSYNYSNLLIELSSRHDKLIPYINPFSKHPLKDRIRLLIFSAPVKLQKIQFITGIPVLLLVIFSYGFMLNEFNQAADIQFVKVSKDFIWPYPKTKRISGYFVKKRLENKDILKKRDFDIFVSHPEISFETLSYTPVIASRAGIVQSIDTIDNWGVDEIRVKIVHSGKLVSIYKGLWKLTITLNQRVKQGQKIGISGDQRLYPVLSYKLLKNGKPVDPEQYF